MRRLDVNIPNVYLESPVIYYVLLTCPSSGTLRNNGFSTKSANKTRNWIDNAIATYQTATADSCN